MNASLGPHAETLEAFGHLAALSCAATWAFATVVFGRITQTVGVRTLNFVKTALSAACLVATSLVLGDIPMLSWQDFGALMLSAACGLLVADTAYFTALRELGPARGVVFVSLIPVATALLAVPVLGEPVTWRMVAGMILTLGGVTYVVRTPLEREPGIDTTAHVALPTPLAHARPSRRGLLAGVVYCAAQAAANVLTKGTDPSLTPLALSSVRMSLGALFLGAWLFVVPGARPRFEGVRASAWGIVSGTLVGTYIGVFLGTFALRTVSAGVSTTLIATTPLFALAFAWVGGQRPTARAALGAAAASTGVAILVL